MANLQDRVREFQRMRDVATGILLAFMAREYPTIDVDHVTTYSCTGRFQPIEVDKFHDGVCFVFTPDGEKYMKLISVGYNWSNTPNGQVSWDPANPIVEIV